MGKIVCSMESLDTPFNFQYPTGVTIITSRDGDRDNAMAVAWHMAISRIPALYGICISPKRFTHGLISASGEFVVNFMPYEQGRTVALVAGCSGYNMAKIETFDIPTQPGSEVGSPVLTDAFASYECRVIGKHQYGDHDLFVGQVLVVHYDPAQFLADGRLDLEQVQPIVYLGRDWYASTDAMVHLDRDATLTDLK